MSQLNNMPNFKTAQEAEQWAAAQGVALTARDRERLGEMQASEQARARTSISAGNLLARFNSGYAMLLDAMLHIANLLQALIRTVIVGAGVLSVLVFLAVVEQQRLVSGLMLFEERADVAGFAAWAVVLLNLILEFVIEYDDSRHRWTEASRRVWSLRIFAKNMFYRLGLGKKWTPRDLPPSQWARQLLRLVTVGILALSLAGSMRDEIALQSGKPWYEGYRAILETSDALLFSAWVGGLIFAVIAVFGAQGLARYTAHKTAEIIEELRASTPSGGAGGADEVAINFIMAKVAKKQQREAEKAQGDTPVPLGMGTNGKGH